MASTSTSESTIVKPVAQIPLVYLAYPILLLMLFKKAWILVELEPYLYEPVVSHTESSNDIPEDDEVLRNNERLLKQAGKETWPYS